MKEAGGDSMEEEVGPPPEIKTEVVGVEDVEAEETLVEMEVI